MRQPKRPFVRRVPADDAARVAIARELDNRPDVTLKYVSENVLEKNVAYFHGYLFQNKPEKLPYKDTLALADFLNLPLEVFEANEPKTLLKSGTRRFLSENIQDKHEILVFGQAAATDGRIMGLGSSSPSGSIDLGVMINRGYASVVSGSSMDPRYKHGEYVLVIRDEWPSPHQDCLIQTVDGEGMVKIYLSHDSETLVYGQLNPEKKLKMPIEKVLKVEQIRGRWK